MTRQIGVEAMGLLGMVLPVYNLLLSSVTLGLPTILARFVAMDLAKGNNYKIKENKRSSFLLILLFATLTAVGIYFFSPELSSLLYKDRRTATILKFLAPLLILTSFSLIYRGYYRGLGQTLPLAISEMGGVLAESIFVIRYLWNISLLTPQLGINLIMSGTIYGEIITLLILILWDMAKSRTVKRERTTIHSLLPLPTGRGIKYNEIQRKIFSSQKRLLKNSLPLLLQDLIHAASSMADGILIPRLLIISGLTPVQATKTAGFYWGLTLPIYFIPLVFLVPLTTIILPASARASTKKSSLRSFFGKGRRLLLISLAYGVLSFLILLFCGDEITKTLFNASGPNRMLIMILPALPFTAFNLLLTPMVEGLGKQRFLCRATLTVIMIKAGITAALVPNPDYGITGAAWGFIVSQIALSVLLIWRMYRLGFFACQRDKSRCSLLVARRS